MTPRSNLEPSSSAPRGESLRANAAGASASAPAGRRSRRTGRTDAAALLRANRDKDEFLAMLGHELRNSMAPIRNAVDILSLLVDDPDSEIDWAMSVLDRQTTHLTRLLDDLLDVSRIMRGQFKLNRHPVDVREIVRQEVDGVRTLMRERGHHLELLLPDQVALVAGDPVRISQILLNLLLNAANYTPEGGEIFVMTDVDRHHVTVRVRDNGPGIPPQHLRDIFSIYLRNRRQPTGLWNGLGLGLAISRRLAELHGGHLRARSEWPHPGSELSLVLPRLFGPSPAPPQPPALETPPLKRDLRVLVADDNADVAGALAALLQVLGCSVEAARSGTEALAVAARQHPRLALLDIGLPDTDGLDLARRLRKQVPDGGKLALVAITGYGGEEARERSLRAGLDEHLTKPVDLLTLRDLLDRLS